MWLSWRGNPSLTKSLGAVATSISKGNRDTSESQQVDLAAIKYERNAGYSTASGFFVFSPNPA